MSANVFDRRKEPGLRNRGGVVVALLALTACLTAACLDTTRPARSPLPPGATETGAAAVLPLGTTLPTATPVATPRVAPPISRTATSTRAALPPTRWTPSLAPPVSRTATPTSVILQSADCPAALVPAPPCAFPLEGQIVFLSAREDTNADGTINRRDRPGYYAMNLDGTGQCWIPGLQDAQRVAIHPQERKIAFLESAAGQGALVVLDGELGASEVLARDLEEGLLDLLWSPDGQWIAFNSWQYLHVVYAGPGPDRPHYRLPATSMALGFGWFRRWDWSPDSRQLAFVGRGENNAFIYRMERDGSGLTLLTEIPAPAPPLLGVLRWPPDGSQIFITSYHLYWEEIQQRTWENTGPPPTPFDLFAIDPDTGSLTQLTGITYNEICEPEWSPDGQTIFYRTPCSGHTPWTEFLLMDRDGTNHRPILSSRYTFRSGRWSSNGEWIVFETVWAGEPNDRILLIRPNGTDLRQLTDGCLPAFSPMWLPE